MKGSQQEQRRQKWFGAFGKRRTRRVPGRRVTVEPVEGRVLMTADLGGNSFAAATELGVLNGTRQIADFVGRADPNEFYRFQVAGRLEFNLTLDQMTAPSRSSTKSIRVLWGSHPARCPPDFEQNPTGQHTADRFVKQLGQKGLRDLEIVETRIPKAGRLLQSKGKEMHQRQW